MSAVHVFPSGQEFERGAAQAIARELQNAYAERRTASLVLSGGSTPKPVYRMLGSEPLRSQLDWTKIHIFWSDERCVPPDHPESNFRMVNNALLRRVQIPPAHIHRIEGERTPRHAAEIYEQQLRTFFNIDGTQLPRFDLVLLGLGDDGHTASLFPDTPILDEQHKLVSEVFLPRLNAQRISLTFPVINNAGSIMFLVSGATKAQILFEVLERKNTRLPAHRVQPTSGRLIWLVDADAAALLSPHRLQQHRVQAL